MENGKESWDEMEDFYSGMEIEWNMVTSFSILCPEDRRLR